MRQTECALPTELKIGARSYPVYRGQEEVKEPKYLTDALGREAISFIERHKKEPFFLYVPFNAIHVPLQATTRYEDRVANIKDPRHRMLAAMTSALDEKIGLILKKLRDTGLENDTLIVFLSDNGSPIYNHSGSNGPLNGSKCTMYEGGIRVPFCMQWTGRLQPRQVYSNPVSSLDLLPTFLDLAGAKLPADREYDGVNLSPYLNGKEKSAPHDILFWRHGPNFAVRQKNWKLIQIGPDRTHLYDLSNDLGEKTDVAHEYPDTAKQMRASLAQWNKKPVAPLWEPQATVHYPVNGEKIDWEV